MKFAGFSAGLSQAEVKKKEDIEKIASSVNLKSLKNNPVKITEKQIMELLEKIW